MSAGPLAGSANGRATGGHDPVRPAWTCRRCGRAWPCPGARTFLLATYLDDPVLLEMYLATQLFIAVTDLGTTEMTPELLARFLNWARSNNDNNETEDTGMDFYDGPTLRSVRESHNIALRKVARAANMSHGHLSKVERGEPGRPVTPAVLAAYERVTGVRLTGLAGHQPPDADDQRWRRGHLSDARRRTLNAKIAAVAIGGPLGEQVNRILDSTGRILAPARVEDPDVTAVEQIAAACTGLDLRLGGAVVDQQARALLRWASGLLTAEASSHVSTRMHAAVGALGQRAGWAAFDAGSHDVARNLLTIALYAATHAEDPDLRAHVLADLAAQYTYLGFPADALQVARFAEVDERVNPHVRMVINGVKARSIATRGDEQVCRHYLDLATDAHDKATASEITGWQATVATAAHLAATSGHALATLARRIDSPAAREDAQQQLIQAVHQLDPHRQARASALCMAQLATLHLETDQQPGPGVLWARRTLAAAARIRSTRLIDHLTVVRAAAAAHPATADRDTTLGELVAGIDTILTAPQVPAGAADARERVA